MFQKDGGDYLAGVPKDCFRNPAACQMVAGDRVNLERSSMIPFRWRMSRVTMNSSESWSATSIATRASGMTPMV